MPPNQHHSPISQMQHYYYTTDEEDDDNDSDLDNNNDYTKGEPNVDKRILFYDSRRWETLNRVFLLVVCATRLFVDPLYFYALSISDTCMCLFIDGWFVITVTVIRCMTDALHLWNMWCQFSSVAKKRSSPYFGSSTTTVSRVLHYIKANGGFFFDLFVILPLPQVLVFIFLLIKQLAFVIIIVIIFELYC